MAQYLNTVSEMSRNSGSPNMMVSIFRSLMKLEPFMTTFASKVMLRTSEELLSKQIAYLSGTSLDNLWLSRPSLYTPKSKTGFILIIFTMMEPHHKSLASCQSNGITTCLEQTLITSLGTTTKKWTSPKRLLQIEEGCGSSSMPPKSSQMRVLSSPLLWNHSFWKNSGNSG